MSYKSSQSGPVGVMIVGCLGMTASAVIAGTQYRGKLGTRHPFAVTNHPAFQSLDLIGPNDVVFGGWDYSSVEFIANLRIHGHLGTDIVNSAVKLERPQYPGLHSPLDYPLEGADFVRPWQGGPSAVLSIAEDIEDFRRQTGASKIIVVNLASPSLSPPAKDFDLIDPISETTVPSSVAYAVGALKSGAHFVDFTPSHALEYKFLHSLAAQTGRQLAGRDGSTGQTMLKAHLAQLFAWRDLRIMAWYSTNVLGNHDGQVLTQPGYGAAKYLDKQAALPLPESQHKVTIDYLREWGDRKEAWDAIELETWLGGSLSVRIDWRGSDSELAAPLVMDIVSFIVLGARGGDSGLQSQLGFFFKHPFGSEESTLSERWAALVGHYATIS